jgi:hypothetical protein
MTSLVPVTKPPVDQSAETVLTNKKLTVSEKSKHKEDEKTLIKSLFKFKKELIKASEI